MKKIADKFPNRTYKAVSAAIKNLKKGKLGHSEKRSKKKQYNPNPPTPLTYVLVHNYYEENIRRGMTRDATIADIADTLNRSPEWVKQALKIDIRKYIEKEDEENAEFKMLNAKLSKWEQ